MLSNSRSRGGSIMRRAGYELCDVPVYQVMHPVGTATKVLLESLT